MSFILKNDTTIIRAKVTEKGRELLSRGNFNITRFKVGDSEIDYRLSASTKTQLNPLNELILRPKDSNPSIVYNIPRFPNADSLNLINGISSENQLVQTTAQEKGFFDISGSTKRILNSDTFGNEGKTYSVQPDLNIEIENVTGGTTLQLIQSSGYGTIINDPVVGDYLMVNWTNPILNISSTGFTVSSATPYVWYKVEEVTGSIITNDLVVTVDRELPDFSNYSGSLLAKALVYPNNNARELSGDSVQVYYGQVYTSDFFDNDIYTFINNYTDPTPDVPVWNMTIVFTQDIAGIQSTNQNFTDYPSKELGGFVQYIQQLDSGIKNIGIIHYTNKSPNNNYAEKLYENTPVLELPTIMWHKKGSNEIGLILSADTKSELPNLNTTYHELVDENGNSVGKVFNDLKIFVIEDQELLFAMSYKSNRNWTLPRLGANFNQTTCEEFLEITDIEITDP